MPYVQPNGMGIIPRKKVPGRIPRTRHTKANPTASTNGETSAQGLADQLGSTHITSSPDQASQPLTDQPESTRSSIDSQAPSAHSRKSTTTSSMSIPSLADGTTATPSSVSLASPKNPELALPSSDETEMAQREDGKNPVSASTSSISTPGETSLPSGAITPMTDATSLGGLDEHAQRLASYKEGIYAYTRNLYLQAQQSVQRKAAIENLPQFGLNKSGADKKASKRATARRLSSFS